MNAMEDNQNNNNNNDFQPTKELGLLTKYAAENAFGVNKMWTSIERITHFNDLTIGEIFDGTWMVKRDYIRILSVCISRIRTRKVKLKKLPKTLPNLDVLNSLELGLEENLLLYKNTILILCGMPDLPPKKHNSKMYKSSSVLTKKKSKEKKPLYRKTITTNGTLYNYSPPSPDFDYGITDT